MWQAEKGPGKQRPQMRKACMWSESETQYGHKRPHSFKGIGVSVTIFTWFVQEKRQIKYQSADNESSG